MSFSSEKPSKDPLPGPPRLNYFDRPRESISSLEHYDTTAPLSKQRTDLITLKSQLQSIKQTSVTNSMALKRNRLAKHRGELSNLIHKSVDLS